MSGMVSGNTPAASGLRGVESRRLGGNKKKCLKIWTL